MRQIHSDPLFGLYDSQKFRKFNPKYRKKADLSSGEIACALSHLRAAERALENKWEWTLVLEDDAVIKSDRLLEIINLSIRQSLKPRAIILLNSWCRGAHRPSTKKLTESECLIRPNRETMLAGAYLLSSSAAEVIAAEIRTQGVTRGIDWWIAPELNDWSDALNIYAIKPDLVLQSEDIPSMIAEVDRAGGGNIHSGTDPWYGLNAGLTWSWVKWYRLPLNLGKIIKRLIQNYAPPPSS